MIASEDCAERPSTSTSTASKRLSAWGVEQEMVDVRIHQALKTVRRLTKGRTEAAERPPSVLSLTRRSTPPASPVVDLAGDDPISTSDRFRPSEVCLVRPCDIEMTAPVWSYRPQSHKTEHHGVERQIFLGPAAQNVLKPFLQREPDSFCFSPQETVNGRRRGPSLQATWYPLLGRQLSSGR